MPKAKEIIEDANLAACHACNKSSDMWRQYYINRREEALAYCDSLEPKDIEELIDKNYDERVEKIKESKPDKLENEKYMNKVRASSEKYVTKNLIKSKEIEIDKENAVKFGKTYANVIQGTTKLIMKDYNTSNVGCLDQQLVQANWKRDYDSILNCETRVPQYKKNTPYYFYNRSYKLRNYNGYFVDLSMFSKSGYEKYNLKNGTPLSFRIDKLDGNKKATLNKIISGKYKQGSAQISISDKGKIQFIITFSFVKEDNTILDPNRILGIDLGVNKVAVFSIWDDNEQGWDYFKWSNNVIDGEELRSFRNKYYNLKKNLYISSKYVGKGRCGHGYKTKMKPANKVSDKVARFADTYNHKISRYIVNYAVSNNCGVIQMEDLSKATANTHERMLKEWSYYDLQQKITYKAKEAGIEVIKIDPKYTSKRCSECGCIHEDNRNCKENQGKFECQVCGHTENADVNASKNISLPGIDIIIKNTEVIKAS